MKFGDVVYTVGLLLIGFTLGVSICGIEYNEKLLEQCKEWKGKDAILYEGKCKVLK